MKKTLFLAFAFMLLLAGCSKKEVQDKQLEKKQEQLETLQAQLESLQEIKTQTETTPTLEEPETTQDIVDGTTEPSAENSSAAIDDSMRKSVEIDGKTYTTSDSDIKYQIGDFIYGMTPDEAMAVAQTFDCYPAPKFLNDTIEIYGTYFPDFYPEDLKVQIHLLFRYGVLTNLYITPEPKEITETDINALYEYVNEKATAKYGYPYKVKDQRSVYQEKPGSSAFSVGIIEDVDHKSESQPYTVRIDAYSSSFEVPVSD